MIVFKDIEDFQNWCRLQSKECSRRIEKTRNTEIGNAAGKYPSKKMRDERINNLIGQRYVYETICRSQIGVENDV